MVCAPRVVTDRKDVEQHRLGALQVFVNGLRQQNSPLVGPVIPWGQTDWLASSANLTRKECSRKCCVNYRARGSKPGPTGPWETGYLHLRPVLTLDSSFLSFITTFSLSALGSNKYLSNMHVYWVALKRKNKNKNKNEEEDWQTKWNWIHEVREGGTCLARGKASKTISHASSSPKSRILQQALHGAKGEDAWWKCNSKVMQEISRWSREQPLRGPFAGTAVNCTEASLMLSLQRPTVVIFSSAEWFCRFLKGTFATELTTHLCGRSGSN